MNIGRQLHSCSAYKDGGKTMIIAAGGSNGKGLDSVEIYDPSNNKWHFGKYKF